ncbi:MAG: hypothetical protein LBR61_06245 [Synergistaceae bacterium]|jgi:endoglucanase|nr:hypothetical protein [Synergistaceae bacterium]
MTELLALIKNIVEAPAPTGYQKERAEVLARAMEGLADEISFDPLGSLIVCRRGTGGNGEKGRKIMICAPLDSPTLIAKTPDGTGKVGFMPIGTLDPHALVGAQVRFSGGGRGVVAYDASVEMKNLYIDMGSPEHASGVRAGDAATFPPAFAEGDGIVIGASCAAAAACAALVMAAGETRARGDMAFVFAAQAELDARGVRAASGALAPEIGVAIDVIDAGRTKFGHGPSVVLRDTGAIYPRDAVERVETCARRAGVELQREIIDKPDGRETAASHMLRAGASACAIGLPTKGRLSPGEMICLRDAEGVANVLAEIIRTA